MVSSIYLFSREDHSRELQGLLAAAPGKQVLSRVESFDSVGDLADLLVHFTGVTRPTRRVAVVVWSGSAVEQVETVEDFFARSVLPADPTALLWDPYNHTLHDARWPRCTAFDPTPVPAGPVDFHVDVVGSRQAGRCSSGSLLARLQADFPRLFPRSFGQYEPLRRIASGKATLEEFAELWDAGRDVFWRGSSGWEGSASESEPPYAWGPLWSASLWSGNRSDAPDPSAPVDGATLAELAGLLGAVVARTRWGPQAFGSTPQPHCALAPQGWWLGFDATPHDSVFLASQVVDELAGPFTDADGWVLEEVSGGVVATAAPARTPPVELLASLAPHFVAAPVRPWSLMRPG